MQPQIRRRLLKLWLVIGLIAILGWPPIWRLGVRGAQPILQYTALAMDKLSDSLASIFNVNQWRKENQLLRQQVAVLQGKLAGYNQLANENESLRQLSVMPVPPEYKKIGLQIIGQQIDESGTYYLVNRGERDALQVGMPVVVGLTAGANKTTAVLLGTVRSVSRETAALNLTTSSASRLIVQVANDTHTQALAVGEYNLALRLNYVPQDEKIATGQLVLTSNLNPLIPPGLMVGMISQVETTEGNFFKTAVVTPSLNLTNLNYVYVLLK